MNNKIYPSKQPEYIKKYRRAWREKNKDTINEHKREYDALYRKKNKEQINRAKKEWRHKNGISLDYGSSQLSEEQRRFNIKLSRRSSNLKRRRNGRISIKTMQLVYEENIKRHGELICYLCFKKVRFGDDCIEHKTPLVRGGTNERDNLDIAHRSCNYKKNIKTEDEYRKEINHGKRKKRHRNK